MKLEEMTWPEVEAYLGKRRGVFLPAGSVEQHGPVGLIGTDAICAREIALRAARECGAVVAPELAYAPAPFNMAFPGTVSISPGLFERLAAEVVAALAHHGFERVYVLNGHGANVEALGRVARQAPVRVRVRSWWDFEGVDALRRELYGDWEGMHATPSEVAVTQATHRVVEAPGLPPPRKLTEAYVRDHAGDRHGPPERHRRDFPDGRVGSHSALARPEHGARLLDAAAGAAADDFRSFAA